MNAQELDQSASVMMPFFDPDINVVHMGGKGETSSDSVRTPDHGDALHQMLQFITAQRRLDVPVLRALFHFQKGISEGQAEQHQTPGKKSNLKTDSLLYYNSSKEAARDMHLLLSPLQSMSAPLRRTAKTRD